MPSIFLCHASDDKPIVEPIQLALTGAGCTVFYDVESLPPGGDYQTRIRAAVNRCALFVFIASSASIASGKFTLTELSYARSRWPSPIDRVLPVAIGGLRPQELPHYLQAVTVLIPRGNVAAEVRDAVESMLRVLRWRRLKRWAAASILVTLALSSSFVVYRYMPLHGSVAANAPALSKPAPAPGNDDLFRLKNASLWNASMLLEPTVIAAVVSVAKSQVGEREEPLGSNRGPQIDQYVASVGLDPRAGIGWDTAFVYWCFEQGSRKFGVANPMVKTAAATDLLGKSIARRVPYLSPELAAQRPRLIKPGMIFVITTRSGGHVGIVEGVGKDSITTLEGNTNENGSGSGIGVFRKSRPIASVNSGFLYFGKS